MIREHLLQELLAEYAHAAWSGWMQYMFSKSMLHADGSVTIPASLVQRWTRQMNTLYKDLPEVEQRSDLEEAEKMIRIFMKLLGE